MKRCLNSTPTAVQRRHWRKVRSCLLLRQKVIRIADISECCWATVAEYEQDELADGSDEEKRIYKAELRAGS